jgi:hypothetical protein
MNITSGAGNTAIGYAALTTNVDGGYNTAVGYESLNVFEADSANHGQNTAVGYRAGKFVSTGTYNTFLGSGAGQGITGTKLTGDSNTAIGQDSGILLQGAAHENTFVGQGSGDVVTTGSDNTCIGFGADTDDATAVNQTVIGHSTTGVADNSVTLGNADVTSVYMASDSGAKVYAGGLGIGTTTVPHGGVGVGLVSIEGANADLPTGPNMSFTTVTDDFPLMVLQNYQHDDVSIVFDAYHDGSAWKSSDASNFMIQKITNTFTMQYDSGITAGSALTWNIGFSMATSGVMSGDFNDTSDVALKKNVKTLTSGLTEINALRPVSFDWKEETKGSNSGFIAQEIEKILPNDVSGEDYIATDEGEQAGNIGKAINVTGIVAHLVKAVQELSAKVEALEAK